MKKLTDEEESHYLFLALHDYSSTRNFLYGTRSSNTGSNFCTGKSFFLFPECDSHYKNKLGTDARSSIWLVSSFSTVLKLSSKASAMMLGLRYIIPVIITPDIRVIIWCDHLIITSDIRVIKYSSDIRMTHCND